MTGEPPSYSGAFHVNLHKVLVTSLNVKSSGAPGNSTQTQMIHSLGICRHIAIFSRTSRTLRDVTQIVTFLSVTKNFFFVRGPIADQSQSAVGTCGHPALCHLCGRIAAHRLAHPWRPNNIPLGILV